MGMGLVHGKNDRNVTLENGLKLGSMVYKLKRMTGASWNRCLQASVISPRFGLLSGSQPWWCVVEAGITSITGNIFILSSWWSYLVNGDSYGSGMEIVWEAYHKGVPLLGVPENPTD